MSKFDDAAVVITGAGGDIGRATAVAFARHGLPVAIFDRKAELLDETTQLCEAVGAEVLPLGVDQTQRDVVDHAFAQVQKQFGPVRYLFANAGYGKFATFLDQRADEWDRHVAVNLTGTFHVCQAAARQMVAAKRGGSIVVNASSGAVQYTDLLGAYCSTKAALRMLVIGMASELGNHRIRVNGVLPGVVETGMTAPMLNGQDGAMHRGTLLAKTPVGRLGLAEDVASLAVFLASDDAGFISGAEVRIDGGQTIHGHPQWYRTDYQREFESTWSV